MNQEFGKGLHRITKVKRLKEGSDKRYCSSEDDSDDYEYEEEEENQIDDEFRVYLLNHVDDALQDVCREEGCDWNRKEFFKMKLDPELDKLITKARERVKICSFETNRQFCRMYNLIRNYELHCKKV
jgi:predicted site-specific integrase-resolvase